MKKRVAIYARVSTQEQAEQEVPIAAQIRECTEFASRQGWDVVEVFKDEGIRGGTDERPGFQEMIERARQSRRPFDVILVWKRNRLSRNTEHRLAYRRMLRRYGIEIVPVSEPVFEGALETFMETQLAAADELYVTMVAQDTLRGLKEIARQGCSAGGHPPRGYRAAKHVVGLKRNGEPIFRTLWEPDPEWRDKALLAFQMYAEGRSFREIIGATGVCKNKSSLSTYLRNRAFVGERVYNVRHHVDTKAIRRRNPDSEWVVVPGAHEAVVPSELFDRVQERLSRNYTGRFVDRTLRSDYLLAGLLWCTEHNCHYVGYSNRTRAYYACSLRNKNQIRGSECRLLKRDAIEAFVLKVVADEVFQTENVRRGLLALERERTEERKGARAELERIDAQIESTAQELERYQAAIGQGVDPRAVAKPINVCYARLAELGAEKARLDARAIGELHVSDSLIQELVNHARETLERGEPQTQKLFLREVLERVEVTGETLTVHYSFQRPAPKVAQPLAPRAGFEPTT